MSLRAFVAALVGVALFMYNGVRSSGQPPMDPAQATIGNRFLKVTVTAHKGSVAVTDKRTGMVWAQPEDPAGRHDRNPFREVARDGDGIRFVTSAGGTDLRVTLQLIRDRPEMVVETDVADRSRPFGGALSLDAFLPHTREAYLAIADYCDGHLYPLTTDPFPKTWLPADRLNMPWFGVADSLTGPGYCAIIETSDDACVDMQRVTIQGTAARAPRIGWLPSKKTFAYPRRAVYHFADRGGYVALAKAYRAYAKRTGLLRTLAEKARRNPNVRRLYGAVDVWGDASLAFAREAREAGVRRMLIHGSASASDMRAINALGYLTSEYDNYTDILPVESGKHPDSSHDVLPDAAVLNEDGSRMKAWLTYDKKTQYMKRCPSLWETRATAVIADVLKRLPFLGRFIDVTTAEGLYECYDPAHPLTRADKRRCGERLLATVDRMGLVVGGEHGIWWAVPHLHYIEGMMSSYQFAWPAGHLIRPKHRNEKFEGPYGTDTWENYERWGLGHAHRAPLWQLVFHDCVVSTWYWGDSNDFLLRAAPELTQKKDAFNVLYGTIPMLWAVRDGAWHADRRAFLRTAHTATQVHGATAESAMVDHAFVTPDRAVQRTRFANGTVAMVNFGSEPRRVTLGGQTYLLPQNGFAVVGPGLRQFRHVTKGRLVTSVERSGFMYWEDGPNTVTAWTERADTVRVTAAGTGRTRLPLPTLVKVASRSAVGPVAVYRRNARGERVGLVYEGESVGRTLEVAQGSYDLLFGEALARPDLVVVPGVTRLNRGSVRQGVNLDLRIVVRNVGGRMARAASITVFADSRQADRILARRTVTIPPRSTAALALSLPTGRLDGDRSIIVLAEAREGDLCPSSSMHRLPVTIIPDTRLWKHRASIEVSGTLYANCAEPIVFPVQARRVAPASVRVWETTGASSRACPAQWESLPEGAHVCFLPTSPIPHGTSRRFVVVWNTFDDPGPSVLSLPSDRYDPHTHTIHGATYRCRLPDGVIRDVSIVAGGREPRPVLSKIMASSAETGWTDEPGTVRRRQVLADGPVRTVIEIAKDLRNNVSYTKRFTFQSHGFDVEGRITPQVAVGSRSYYLAGGTFADSQGNTAVIDGAGDAEGVSHRSSRPEWYEVRGDTWAHSCVALTDYGGITYWDSAEWGGIGFVGPVGAREALAYRFHATAQKPGFASHDRLCVISKPSVRILEGKL